MHEKLMDIQNSFWRAYKDFSETKDMGRWNKDLGALAGKYNGDRLMFGFVKWLAFAWSPIVNEMMGAADEVRVEVSRQ